MEKNLRQEEINIVKVVIFGPESTGKMGNSLVMYEDCICMQP